jgi:hypothetical protein
MPGTIGPWSNVRGGHAAVALVVRRWRVEELLQCLGSRRVWTPRVPRTCHRNFILTEVARAMLRLSPLVRALHATGLCPVVSLDRLDARAVPQGLPQHISGSLPMAAGTERSENT